MLIALGGVTDDKLTTTDQIALRQSVVWRQIRLNGTYRALLLADVAKTLSIIFGRLDYCNALMYGIIDRLTQRLQQYRMRLPRRQVDVHRVTGSKIT